MKRRAIALGTLVLAAIAFGVFAARTAGPYHFDDWVTPVSDPASQSLAAFFNHLGRTLRPLSKLTFALEQTLGWGSDPARRRAVSALFHAASCGLLFQLGVRLGGRIRTTAAAVAIYAVHPIHAEVIWALAGRGTAMATLLLLGALLAQLRRRLWLAGGLFLAACLCRETALFGALALGALELSRRRNATLRLSRLEPAVTALLLGAAFVLQNARYRELIDYSSRGRPFAWSVAAQVEAVPVGLSLYARPGALTLDHGEAFTHSFLSLHFWLGVAIFAALAVLLVRGVVRRRPLVAVGSALVLAALLPTQSIVPKLDPLTERPFAAALAGLTLLAVAAAGHVRAIRRWPRVAALVWGVTATWLVFATLRRGSLYASEIDLWRDAARKTVVNARPHYNLAHALADAGHVDEALAAVRAARRIDPFDSEMRSLEADLVLGVRLPPP